MSIEQRSEQRKNLIYNLKVIDYSNNTIIGRVINLSSNGMKLLCDKNIVLNSNLKVLIEFPAKLVSRKKHDFLLDVECMWTGIDKNPNYKTSGFTFKDLNHSDSMTLNYVMDYFSYSNKNI